ncbi:MAG TPA: TldD/PmbA family protein [Polyangiaceae bacterium]
MIGEKEMEAIARRALDAVAREVKGAEAEVWVESSRSGNIRFAMDRILSCGDGSEEAISLSVALGRRHVDVSTNQTDDASLAALAQRAAAMVRLAPEDPEAMPLLGPQRYLQVPGAYDEAFATVSPESRAATAQASLAAFRAAGVDGAGYFEHSAGRKLVANSAGLAGRHRSSFGRISTTARTKDGDGSGWGMCASHEARGIDASEATHAAIDRGLRSVRPRALPPGRYTVVLEPAAVDELLWYLEEHLQARAVDEGQSALSKPGGASPLGDRIASDFVQLVSDPADPELPCAPFGYEGVARKPLRWVDQGRLGALFYSRYWAEKQHKEATSYGAWHLSGGKAASVDELVRGVDRGLLVTRFHYVVSLDPKQALVTGLTRDGVFLVERGEIVGPVNNFRFNESPLGMLSRCDAMTSRTVRASMTSRVPALRTHDFHMASVSEAV